jgi:hypothetical protein
MKIRIAVPFDFTPSGKRRARVVRTTNGGRQLRWYVGGRLYARNPPAALTEAWLANEGAADHWPQPWALMQ